MKFFKECVVHIVVFIVMALAVAGLVVVSGRTVDEPAESESVAESLPTDTSQPADAAELPDVIEEATLTAVGSIKGSGGATRSFGTSGFNHEIVASLQLPAEGKFYEGWLVGDSVVSTGALTDEGDNEWSLVFTSDTDLRNGHDAIVVTEETLEDGLDGKPEKHVLEGSF